MQILQWLFNMAAQEPPKIVTSIRKCDEEKKMKQKDTIVSVADHRGRRRQLKGVEKSKLNCENLVLFRFLQRKDVSKPFFYQTLNLKGLGSFRHSRKTTRREEIDHGGVAQPAALGGNKVLPIALDSAHSDSDERDYEAKGNKKKVVIRVKELLKWAANAKKFNKKAAASNVAVLEYDQFCDESPKISISWEMTTTTTTTHTTSSTKSRASSTSRDDRIECGDSAAGIGNWITTDSEFVVLEL